MRKMFEPVWKNASKKWKNPLHNMCSYLAMFPPALPNYFIEQFSAPGDYILDPFSGRGTALLEASILGRKPVGNDLNPLAFVLSSAKVKVPDYKIIMKRIDYLEKNYQYTDISDEPDDIKMLYDLEITLPQLCYLKDNLNRRREVDNFILGALMGIMHGKHRTDGTSAYLSISMPNTFSMSPNYVRKYISEKQLIKIQQNVFQVLRNKITSIYPYNDALTRGEMYFDNALNLTKAKYKKYFGKIKLIITSPPYLKVINYGKYNWIRLWLLDKSSKEVDENLRLDKAYNHSAELELSDDMKLEQYLVFMRKLICGWEKILTEDGLAVVVIGDVDSHNDNYIDLAEQVWRYTKPYTKLHLVEIIRDEIDGNSKVTKIWGKERKGDATKIDKLLVLSKGNEKINANIKKNISSHFRRIYGGNKNELDK